jgi:hypothetical protein
LASPCAWSRDVEVGLPNGVHGFSRAGALVGGGPLPSGHRRVAARRCTAMATAQAPHKALPSRAGCFGVPVRRDLAVGRSTQGVASRARGGNRHFSLRAGSN